MDCKTTGEIDYCRCPEVLTGRKTYLGMIYFSDHTRHKSQSLFLVQRYPDISSLHFSRVGNRMSYLISKRPGLIPQSCLCSSPSKQCTFFVVQAEALGLADWTGIPSVIIAPQTRIEHCWTDICLGYVGLCHSFSIYGERPLSMLTTGGSRLYNARTG